MMTTDNYDYRNLPRFKYSDLANTDVKNIPILNSVKFWGVEGQELLNDTDIDDCILHELDEYVEHDISDLGLTLEIFGFRPRKKSIKVDPSDILESLLGNLDEEFGDIDWDPSKPTDAMISAATQLASIVEMEYVPRICEPICVVEVDVSEWIRENNREWLGNTENP